MTDVSRQSARKVAVVMGAVLMIAVLLAATPAQAKKKEIIESYTANVMVMDAPGQSNSSILTMNIYEWSTDEDREKILDAVKEATDNPRNRSMRGVSTALRKNGKAGYLFLMGEQGWPIRYTRELQTSNGREIVLALDRPVTFSEVYTGSQAQDFDVTLIVLKLDSAGKGEGVASVGSEVIWNNTKDQLEVTNYSSQPIKLTNVRPSKK